MEKALLLGSSGLIGSQCLKQLMEDDYFSAIEIWVRTSSGLENPKIKETIINFNEIANLPCIDAKIVFCCLGTTIKNAKTKEAFKKVDYDYVVKLAKLAEKSGVEKFLVISSIGANAQSKNFYLRTKGEMEETITQCQIPSIFILRPSILFGKRKEFRLGEKMGKLMMRLFTYFLFGRMKKYRGIEASTVAKAMINLAKETNLGVQKLESNEINRKSKWWK